MERLKQSFKENLLNEDKIYKSIISKTSRKNNFRFVNYKLSISLSIFAILVVLFLSNLPSMSTNKQPTTLGISTPLNKLAYALVSVDINPSFELYLDINDNVIEINSLNEEAKSLSSDNIIGLPIQDAVEELIKQAQDAGFINLADTNQDSVIISTISYGIDGSKLIKNIQVKLRSSLNIDRSIKSYIIQANDDDRKEAKRKNISLGIYMLNGLIHNNGVPMNVQSFLSDLNNLEVLEEYAEKTNGSELVSVIQVLINELNRLSINTTKYQDRLNTDGEDLEELIEDLKDTFESLGYGATNQKENNESDDSENDHESED